MHVVGVEDAESITLAIGILARDLEVRYDRRVILMQTPGFIVDTQLSSDILRNYLPNITELLANGWEESIACLHSSCPNAQNSADESNVALQVKATTRIRKQKPTP